MADIPVAALDRPRVGRGRARQVRAPVIVKSMTKKLNVKSWRCEMPSDVEGAYSEARSEPNVIYELLLVWDKNDESAMTMKLQDNAMNQVITLKFPTNQCALECRLLPSESRIDLRRYTPSTNKLIYHLVVVFDTTAQRSLDAAFDIMTARFSSMGIDQLRHLNLPRPSDAIPPAVQVAAPRSLSWPLLYLGFEVEYTGEMAEQGFMDALSWMMGEVTGPAVARVGPATRSTAARFPAALPAAASVTLPAPAPPTVPALPDARTAATPGHVEEEDEEQDQAEIDERERLRLRRLAVNHAGIMCGWCGEGEAPTQGASIARRVSRGRWIGCENDPEDCGSPSFWFHMTEDCAGITKSDYKKGFAWWCASCRVDRPRADNMGFERRPGARTGMITLR